MRGDRPVPQGLKIVSNRFTPHARGSTLLRLFPLALRRVYPACAGIDRFLFLFLFLVRCLPRMRGDRPFANSVIMLSFMFTPHARGSTL